MLKYHVRRPAIHHSHADGAKLGRLAFVVNVGDAAFWTIIPIHLAHLFGGDGPVGYYFAAVALVGAIATVYSIGLFKRHNKAHVGAVALGVMATLLLAMSFADQVWVFAVFDIPRSAGFVVVTIVLGLLVRDNATAANLAIEEGRFYLFSNLGWLLGPLLAGYVALWFGPDAVFVVVAAIFAVALGYLWRLKAAEHPAVADTRGLESRHETLRGLVAFLRTPNLRGVFVLAIGLELWWVISSIYIPLAVIDLGYQPDVVGWVVAAGVLPLVLLEAWVGRQAQRKGTTTYLAAGFLILGLGALAFVVLSFSPVLLLFLFAAVNVGAAFVEPLTDTYFFEVSSDENTARFFGIYNGAAPLAALLGPLVAAAVFGAGLGLNGVWILAAVLMAATAWVAVRLPSGA